MPSRLIDDVTRLANDAATALGGLRGEVETMVKSRIERVLSELDMVPREEFETVRQMAALAREEQEALAQRVAALEAKLAELEPKPKTKTPPKADS
ncbi:conserved hypothetical protein [uncultured Alphaproteobacteria bacterium]|uniref:Accessory factor UbiK family protein n=1 Tax=uncultured Alphaproteobacteria bacterium TaxID=91750 RepID=A0A212JWF3_9PROT|nr:conserved hypothetical protein [uncultured Alphaproteobacteria bacterium]